MKKLLALLLSLSMVFFCACGSAPYEEVAEDTSGEEFYSEEYLNDSVNDEDSEYPDTMSSLSKDTQHFISLLMAEDYYEICDIYGINHDDFPEECVDKMISLAFSEDSPEFVLSEYVDSYEIDTSSAPVENIFIAEDVKTSEPSSYTSDTNEIIKQLVEDPESFNEEFQKFRSEEKKTLEEARALREKSAEETTQLVYVTKNGSKYHSYGCQYLKKSCIEKDLSDAKSQGYIPCSKCW
jgi:hypothetical protein